MSAPLPVHKPTLRLLNAKGRFNVIRVGRQPRRAADLYHKMLATTWPRVLAAIFTIYLVLNLVFAGAYWACGPGALEEPANGALGSEFLKVFFFSVQTFATIGYGRISPVGLAPNILVTLESLTGLLSFAVITGLIFSRFSRPTARILFSQNALWLRHDGVPSLIFRIANERLNQVVEAHVFVSLTIDEVTAEGEYYRNFYDLKLDRNRTAIFALSLTIVHPVIPGSPLAGLSLRDMAERNAEIIVSVSGTDETLSQVIHARHSYVPAEILENHTFQDMLERVPEGIRIDLGKIHSVIPVSPSSG